MWKMHILVTVATCSIASLVPRFELVNEAIMTILAPRPTPFSVCADNNTRKRRSIAG